MHEFGILQEAQQSTNITTTVLNATNKFVQDRGIYLSDLEETTFDIFWLERANPWKQKWNSKIELITTNFTNFIK